MTILCIYKKALINPIATWLTLFVVESAVAVLNYMQIIFRSRRNAKFQHCFLVTPLRRQDKHRVLMWTNSQTYDRVGRIFGAFLL
jgi:hypothetical protein